MTMKRIIKSNEVPGGTLSSSQKTYMAQVNANPKFEEKKPWDLVKVLRTSTTAIAWHIRIDDTDYRAVQSWVRLMGETVTIYPCDKKGNVADYGKEMRDKSFVYPMYVDLESAVDAFYEKMQSIKEEELNEISDDNTND